MTGSDLRPTDADRHAAGMRIRREVLGDAHVERAVARTTPFTEPFQEFLTRYAWGEVWARPGLDRRTRSAVTLAVLTALHCRDEIAMHIAAARRNGLSVEEISEVLLHTAVYAGLPAANSAFAIASDALREAGLDPRVADAPTEAADLAGPVEPEIDDPQVGEAVCPQCAGRGSTAAGPCPNCDGSGVVTELVGDA